MTIVVPFDGSELAEAGLVRATEFGHVFDEAVLAVSVIPEGNVHYARDKGWIGADEAYSKRAIISTLHEQVTELCPSANFRHETISSTASVGAIGTKLRSIADEEDASMVVIGSENAGRIATTLSSVGDLVTADETYDVIIVRNRAPSKIEKIRNATPNGKSHSDYYLPE